MSRELPQSPVRLANACRTRCASHAVCLDGHASSYKHSKFFLRRWTVSKLSPRALQSSGLQGRHRPLQPSRANAMSPISAPPHMASVWDYLLLFQIKPGIDEASAQKMLDDFWSLQYLIPAGVVTAFAGALRPAGVKDTDLKLTHAVHMRFSSMQQLHAFRQHEKMHAAKAQAKAKMSVDMAELAIHGFVPRELESIFRRGSEWDLGFDSILLLQAQEDAQDEEMAGFLEALSALSLGPGMQALQSTYAPLHLLSGKLPGSHVLFSRFQTEQQLDNFVKCPPYAALQRKDARLPAVISCSHVISIIPSDANRTRDADGKGVLGVSNK